MGDLAIRPATVDDIPAIVAMLADDPLGAQRESPDDLAPYLTAMERLRADPTSTLSSPSGKGGSSGRSSSRSSRDCPGVAPRGRSSKACASTRTNAAVGWAAG